MDKKGWLHRNLPNLISIGRIAISVIIFFTFDNTKLFITLYLLCGISDVLDGYIARKTNTQSVTGARLDSVADFLFTIVIFAFFIITFGDIVLRFWMLPVVVACIRIVNIIIVRLRYSTFAILHTYGNKIAGLFLFFLPIVYTYTDNSLYLWIVFTVALLSSLEEMLIHLINKTLDVNRAGIWVRK